MAAFYPREAAGSYTTARDAIASGGSEIALEAIGGHFARLYWDQVVIYHLRQAASLTKEAEVIKAIRAVAETTGIRKFSDVPQNIREELAKRMARILRINVLNAFHTSKPVGMEPFYRWAGEDRITLSGEAMAFLRSEGLVLEVIANYHWARFLESCNRLAPHIITKVERGAVARRSVRGYFALLSDIGNGRCFYCEDEVVRSGRPHVDHVIPWSFLLEDPLWDLVIACSACNTQKSDRLPAPKFIDKLVERNQTHRRICLDSTLGAHHDDPNRYYDAAVSVEWPGFWKPPVTR